MRQGVLIGNSDCPCSISKQGQSLSRVIYVGADNRFGHPCDEVLERLEELPVCRTDEQGAIEIVSDGMQMRVEVER